MAYRCESCGKDHYGLPDIGFEKPEPWFDVPVDERAARVKLTSDTCEIDAEHFFIRGVLSLPIVDGDPGATFGLGVWVSQAKHNFHEYLERFDSAEIGPFFGWLSSRITYYAEDTFLLQTMAHFRGGELRPAIVLAETDHPLSIHHRRGISLAEAWRIVHHYERPN